MSVRKGLPLVGVCLVCAVLLSGIVVGLAHVRALSKPALVATARVSPEPSLELATPALAAPSPTATATATAAPPTPRPSARPSAVPSARLCTAADIHAFAGVMHEPPFSGAPGSPIVHPGDHMGLTGYFSFSPGASGCRLPASTERISVLDPSGAPVAWWGGASIAIPAATGAPPGGCGCGAVSGPRIISANVVWMCSSSGACSSAPTGTYTLVATLTLDSGQQLIRVTAAVPVQPAS